MACGWPSVAHRGSRELAHRRVLVEAFERERSNESGSLLRRDQLCKRRPHDRSRLEAVRAPAAADEEPLGFGDSEDRAVVRREVAEPGPRAEDLRLLELREELEDVLGRVFEEREG